MTLTMGCVRWGPVEVLDDPHLGMCAVEVPDDPSASCLNPTAPHRRKHSPPSGTPFMGPFRWALGAMLYEMRTGRTCFAAADEPTLRLRIANGFKGGSDGFPWLPRMSKDCRVVISALLVKTPPEERLRAHQVTRTLHSTPWDPSDGTPLLVKTPREVS